MNERGTSGEQARPGNLALGTLAGIVAAAVAAGIYYALVRYVLTTQWAAPFLIVGPLVGGAVRLAGRGRDNRFRATAAALAVAGCVVGWIAFDLYNWRPFIWSHTLGRILDLLWICLYALSAYFAWLLAARRV